METLLDLVGRVSQSQELSLPPQNLIELGSVYINDKREMNPETELTLSDIIRVHFKPKRYETQINPKTLIVFENDDFLIARKPSGIPVHATLDNAQENLLSLLGCRALLTHRIDVPTEGLVVFGKTQEFQTAFNLLLSQKRVEKTYLAVTEKPVPLGLHVHFMTRNPRAPKTLTLEKSVDFPFECRLIAESSKPLFSTDLFETKINLETGRTHQIRAQIKYLGAPIVNDDTYEGKIHNFFGLCASEIQFTCPVEFREYSFRITPSWYSH